MQSLSPLTRLLALCSILIAAHPFSLFAEPVSPKIFFTDLLSGPATGGESGEGVFVTLYGHGFGNTRGVSTVTIGREPAHAYPIWTDRVITVQIGRSARSGEIAVHVNGRSDSNGVPFTVRAGHIYFVATDGEDGNPGTFDHPLRSLLAARDLLEAGDVAYARDGVQQGSLDRYDSAFSIETSGKAGLPLAIVAYPGAHVTIGTFSSPSIAARTPNIERTSDHWVLAGLTFKGAQEAFDLTDSTDWRMIGNDFSCPNGFGPTGCIETEQVTHLAFLGNTIHDIARPRTTKVYHALYFSTDSNHLDIGWNLISRVRGCRGIQFHSTPLDPGTGLNQYDLRIHDNIIHDVVCDGINLATIDPSKGPIEIYNNLIYNVGTGPDPEDGSSNYSCIYTQGGTNAGKPGHGIVDIHHNTLLNCGARGNTDSGALSYSKGAPDLHLRLWNNIIAVHHGVPLLSPNSATLVIQGQENIFWNGEEGKSERLQLAFRTVNPLLGDADHGNFAPRQSSLAAGMGASPELPAEIRDGFYPVQVAHLTHEH